MATAKAQARLTQAALLRNGQRLMNDTEIRDLFIEAFDPRRNAAERQVLIDVLKGEMHKQISAFVEHKMDQLQEYDRSRGKSAYVRSERAEFEVALEMGVIDYRPDPKRLTFSRLVNGDMTGEVLALPKDTIVVPIMSSGMLLASGIISAIQANGGDPEMVMLGYPKREWTWDNAEKLPKQVFITGADRDFLMRNTNRTVLVVDDMIESGVTMQKVVEFLKELGFSDVRRLVFCANNEDLRGQQGRVII